MKPIAIEIPIPPATKKNSQRIVMRGRRPIILQSEKYVKYEKDAGKFLKHYVGMNIAEPVNIKCIYYMPTRRRVDLTNLLEATDDMLVKYEVLADDNRNIVATHDGSMVLYDKEHPRTEILIEPKKNYMQW